LRAPLPLLPLLDDCLRVNQAHNFIYLNNPKVGCSTVKAAVWKAVAPDTFDPGKGVHDLARSPAKLNPHWRPQFLNICYPFITPDFIGRLENMDGQLPDVLGHIFGKQLCWRRISAA